MSDVPVWFVVLTISLVAVGIVYTVRDVRRRHTLGRFAALLDPENRAWLDRLALSAETYHAVVRGCTDDARGLWEEDPEAARLRLRLACEQIERVTLPRFLETLSVLRRLARTVKVFPPPRPLAVAAYQLARTRGLAALASLLHWLGLTGRDRVRVRLWFVKRAFVTAARIFTGTAVLAVDQGFGKRWYPTLDAAVTDMKLAQDETVVTAEHILAAFARWKEYRRPA